MIQPLKNIKTVQFGLTTCPVCGGGTGTVTDTDGFTAHGCTQCEWIIPCPDHAITLTCVLAAFITHPSIEPCARGHTDFWVFQRRDRRRNILVCYGLTNTSTLCGLAGAFWSGGKPRPILAGMPGANDRNETENLVITALGETDNGAATKLWICNYTDLEPNVVASCLWRLMGKCGRVVPLVGIVGQAYNPATDRKVHRYGLTRFGGARYRHLLEVERAEQLELGEQEGQEEGVEYANND